MTSRGRGGILPRMDGVTTALVAFLFVCVVFPNLIKNRTQYYAAFGAVCLVIILDALGMAISGAEGPIRGFRVFVYVANAALQVTGIVMLFLGAGGITWRALANDMREAYEVIRRGGEEKEVIIPLSPEMERLRQQRQAAAAANRSATPQDPEKRQPIVINDPSIPPAGTPVAPPPPTAPAGAEPKPPESGRIPLEP